MGAVSWWDPRKQGWDFWIFWTAHTIILTLCWSIFPEELQPCHPNTVPQGCQQTGARLEEATKMIRGLETKP